MKKEFEELNDKYEKLQQANSELMETQIQTCDEHENIKGKIENNI